MAAQPILQAGHCWRVGNGHSINAVKDRWLPNFPTNKVLNSVQENGGKLMVADLINLELNIWKYEDIRAIFHTDEAEAICQIPLSQRNVPDFVFWLHNARGLFSVKSAYHMARWLLTDANRGGTSTEGAAKNIWTTEASAPKQNKSFCLESVPQDPPNCGESNQKKGA